MPITFAVDPSKRPSQDDSFSSLIRQGNRAGFSSSIDEYLSTACPDQAKTCGEILQASFGEAVRVHVAGTTELEKMMSIGRGGLVDVASTAYNRHYHLVLRFVESNAIFVALTITSNRPDDIWIAILSQLSF